MSNHEDNISEEEYFAEDEVELKFIEWEKLPLATSMTGCFLAFVFFVLGFPSLAAPFNAAMSSMKSAFGVSAPPTQPVTLQHIEVEPYRQKTNRDELKEYVRIASTRHNVEPELIWAVISVESNFDADALSKKGAMGLMQLMPDTAREVGARAPFDPYQNILGGTSYLSKMLKQFHGNVDHALAAYNAGPMNVRRYRGIPPYAETKRYVRLVKNNYQQERARSYRNFSAEKPKISTILDLPKEAKAGERAPAPCSQLSPRCY